MKRKSLENVECPIANAVDEVGDAWTLVLVRSALLGARTFSDFEAALEIPASTLARRLDELGKRGLIERSDDGYALTQKGRELLPVLLALGAWGNKWLAPTAGPCLVMVDPVTTKTIDPMLVDRRTKKPLGPGQVALTAGPGASAKLRKSLPKPAVLGR